MNNEENSIGYPLCISTELYTKIMDALNVDLAPTDIDLTDCGPNAQKIIQYLTEAVDPFEIHVGQVPQTGKRTVMRICYAQL